MKKFAAGVILTLVCLIGGAYAYFAGGFAPVATASSPMPFEKNLAKIALNAKLQKEMPRNVPIEANEANFIAGAHEYLINCAVCHGVPGKEKTAIARGEFPAPPELFHGKGVSDDPPGETFWKVNNGIRLSGMPSFHDVLTETQVWQVSLLLANADKPLPPEVLQIVRGVQQTPAIPAPSTQKP